MSVAGKREYQWRFGDRELANFRRLEIQRDRIFSGICELPLAMERMKQSTPPVCER